MPRPIVLNAHNGYHNFVDAVWVGRPSPWGNPYVIGRDGTRAEVIELYRVWIAERPDRVDKLRAMNPGYLVCACSPEACHADVLAGLLDDSVAVL
jgi:hypothetical protein